MTDQIHNWLNNVPGNSAIFAQMCKPLEDSVGLTFTRVTRVYHDDTMSVLSSRPDIIHWFYDNNLDRFGCHDGQLDDYESGFVLYDHLNRHNTFEKTELLVKPLRQSFNCGAGLVMFAKSDGHTDILEVALSTETDAPNSILMRNYHRFEKFFQSKVQSCPEISNLLDSTKTRCIVTSEIPSTNVSRAHLIIDEEQGINKLSPRELLCTYWYTKGKLIPDIASILGISSRTVEVYVNNLKSKLNAYTPFQIGMTVGKFHEHFEILYNELAASYEDNMVS